MQLKDYQQRVLDAFDTYLDELIAQRNTAENIRSALVQAGLNLAEALSSAKDFPTRTWDELAKRGLLPAARNFKPYSPRWDGMNRPVPNVTLKIPTGGGKTLLAASGTSRVLNKYLTSNTGFILWIVPSEAIYSQTKRQLTDRDHPYRQMLDRASAGRVKILEKDSPLHRADVESHLCIMVLMLQSANRETKETLRLFRDRGNVHGFTPSGDDGPAHQALISAVSNLDVYAADLETQYPVVMDSLGNALRLLRPIIVMDEGHKAYGDLAVKTLHGFNPSFVLELSATPRDGKERWANWLVDVRGTDLEREEMIKLPINLTVKGGDDWRDCLRQAWERTQRLQTDADALHANTARYIRPIMLVQVERTGKEMRDAGFIHSKDVIEFMQGLGLHENEIAEKTAEVNDLKDPERQDLLSATNPIRVIVTKQALQEGWDCPFAYLLCSLAAANNLNAMTQLLGRILRQPDAQKTGTQSLDECYVFCHKAQTGSIIAGIKKALENDGMSDLVGHLHVDSGSVAESDGPRIVSRQRRFSFSNSPIFLPSVLWVEDSKPHDLDWEGDILYRVDWSRVSLDDLANTLKPTSHRDGTTVARLGLEITGEHREGSYYVETLPDAPPFDTVYAVRTISDIVPNAWVGRDLIEGFLNGLHENGWKPEQLGSESSFLIEELRKTLLLERDRLAESVYLEELQVGHIQFRLRTDSLNWEMPSSESTVLPERPRQLMRLADGGSLERSLFHPIYEHEMNSLELEAACYLDGDSAIQWWYRNVVKPSGYALQGWRKNRIYPDFIFAMIPSDGGQRYVVLETKGDQLSGNLDTNYKKALLERLTQEYRVESSVKLGTLEIEVGRNINVTCDLVYDSKWKTELRTLLAT